MDNLKDIEKMLMKEMKRLDDDNNMKNNTEDEVKRSQALSNTAQSIIKAKNLGVRIFELKKQYGKDFDIDE